MVIKMNVIHSGDTYEIYSDGLDVIKELPVQTYIVCFHPMTGFSLKIFQPDVVNEKIYGIHESKATKVIRTFEDKDFDRNLGIILSGNKGIGKSLCAKLISQKALESGYPVIIVNTYYPNISTFIASIEQECVILFDEFDKTFGGKSSNRDTNEDPQVEMLSLFDGIVGGSKKIFIITCNELYNINDYLVNRPGRFHYHYRFDFPTPDEIEEYLTDKLKEDYYKEIPKVIAFSRKVSLNYDALRSIAYEINTGETFANAIGDLNIINLKKERYNVLLYFSNGEVHKHYDTAMDLFDIEERQTVYLYDAHDNNYVDVSFDNEKCEYNIMDGRVTIKGEHLSLAYNDVDSTEELNRVKSLVPDHLEIIKCKDKTLHYVI